MRGKLIEKLFRKLGDLGEQAPFPCATVYEDGFVEDVHSADAVELVALQVKGEAPAATRASDPYQGRKRGESHGEGQAERAAISAM